MERENGKDVDCYRPSVRNAPMIQEPEKDGKAHGGPSGRSTVNEWLRPYFNQLVNDAAVLS